jgi:hypothetical protein
MPLGHVVRVRHCPIAHENEQMRPVREHALMQLAARFTLRDGGHDPVEPTVEVIEVLLQGGILQRLSPPSDRDALPRVLGRPQQQPPERRAERRIAALDRVFRVAQQMRQAHLP